jgi:hypothetical protein
MRQHTTIFDIYKINFNIKIKNMVLMSVIKLMKNITLYLSQKDGKDMSWKRVWLLFYSSFGWSSPSAVEVVLCDSVTLRVASYYVDLRWFLITHLLYQLIDCNTPSNSWIDGTYSWQLSRIIYCPHRQTWVFCAHFVLTHTHSRKLPGRSLSGTVIRGTPRAPNLSW